MHHALLHSSLSSLVRSHHLRISFFVSLLVCRASCPSVRGKPANMHRRCGAPHAASTYFLFCFSSSLPRELPERAGQARQHASAVWCPACSTDDERSVGRTTLVIIRRKIRHRPPRYALRRPFVLPSTRHIGARCCTMPAARAAPPIERCCRLSTHCI